MFVSKDKPRSRREFLRVAAAGCAAALAACGGGQSPSSSPAAAKAEAPASVPPSVPAPSTISSAAAGKPVASSSVAASTKPAASPVSSTAKPTAKKLTVAYTSLAATNMPIWMAKDIGALDGSPVPIDLQYFNTGSVATKALISNDIDVLLQGAAAMIAANLNGNVDLVYIGSFINHSSASLHVAKNIKSAADLKGKLVGSDQPGTAVNFQTTRILASLGLQPTDVQLRPLGGSAAQLPVLISGQIQAATLSPPFAFQAESQGYLPLANAYEIPFLDVGVVVSRARINELKPALLTLLAGSRRGAQVFASQPDVALKVMKEFTKEEDATTLQKTYDFYKSKSSFQADLQPSLPAIQGMLEFLGNSSLPEAKAAKPEQFVDNRLLAELPKP